jgi:hypothetical protein
MANKGRLSFSVYFKDYEFYLLGDNAVYSVGSQSTFERNISPTTPHPKDGGEIFIRYVGRLSKDYAALYPRR